MPKANSYIYPGTIALMPPAQIISAVTQAYKVSYADLLINTRKREIVEPRQVLMTLLLIICKEKSEVVGDRFGRDHATALHARKVVARLYETNKTFRTKLRSILHSLKMKLHEQYLFFCELFRVKDEQMSMKINLILAADKVMGL